MQRRDYFISLGLGFSLAGCLRLEETTTETPSPMEVPTDTAMETRTETPTPTGTPTSSPTPESKIIIDRVVGLGQGQYGDWPIDFSREGELKVSWQVREGSKVDGLLLKESEFDNFVPGKEGQYETVRERRELLRTSFTVEVSSGSYVFVLLPSTQFSSKVKLSLVKFLNK